MTKRQHLQLSLTETTKPTDLTLPQEVLDWLGRVAEHRKQSLKEIVEIFATQAMISGIEDDLETTQLASFETAAEGELYDRPDECTWASLLWDLEEMQKFEAAAAEFNRKREE